MARPRKFDREQAIDAALEAFRERGYEATSLPALLEATGLGRQSLYNTFGDKQALFLSCLQRYVDVVAGGLSAALARGSVRKAFHAIFEDVLAQPGARRGCFVLNSTAELGGRNPQVARLTRAALARQERIVADALRRGVREGELRLAPRELQRLARYYTGVLQAVRVMARADPGSAALRDLVTVALQRLDDAAARGRRLGF